jgi:hypothetical protein
MHSDRNINVSSGRDDPEDVLDNPVALESTAARQNTHMQMVPSMRGLPPTAHPRRMV